MIPEKMFLEVNQTNKQLDENKYSFWNLFWYSKLTPALFALITAIIMSWYIPATNHKYQKLRDAQKDKINAIDFFSKSYTEQVGYYNSYKHNLCKSENEINIEYKKLLREKAEKYYSQIIESKYNYDLGISMIKIYFADQIGSIDITNYEKLIDIFFSNENKIDKNISEELCVISESYENNYRLLSDKYNEIFTRLIVIAKEGK